VEVLCVGDLFLSSDRFKEVIEKEMGGDFGPVREVSWAGERAEERHHLQQVMEQDGPEAVPTPEEILEAVW
jgi:D-3-phosphoglycerate dehydrogenase / 2-oxoglutarate reductase